MDSKAFYFLFTLWVKLNHATQFCAGSKMAILRSRIWQSLSYPTLAPYLRAAPRFAALYLTTNSGFNCGF